MPRYFYDDAMRQVKCLSYIKDVEDLRDSHIILIHEAVANTFRYMITKNIGIDSLIHTSSVCTLARQAYNCLDHYFNWPLSKLHDLDIQYMKITVEHKSGSVPETNSLVGTFIPMLESYYLFV
jgi:hypothetical protein